MKKRLYFYNFNRFFCLYLIHRLKFCLFDPFINTTDEIYKIEKGITPSVKIKNLTCFINKKVMNHN